MIQKAFDLAHTHTHSMDTHMHRQRKANKSMEDETESRLILLQGKSRARLRICDILPTSTVMIRTGSSSISDNFLQAQERENNPL